MALFLTEASGVGRVAAMNAANLTNTWQKGQSGNPAGRAKGPTLRTRLRRLEKEAFEALSSCLRAKSRAVRLGAVKVWSDLAREHYPQEHLSASLRIVSGEITEAEVLQMEERARAQLMAGKEE